MAKTYIGSFEIPAGFANKGSGPITDDMVVDNYNDLLDSLEFPFIYPGMIVYASDRKYHYTWNGEDRTKEVNWVQLGKEPIVYSNGSGIDLNNNTFSVNNTVLRTTGNQNILGTKTIKANLLFDNGIYVVFKKLNDTTTRCHGINDSNVEYIGSIDSPVVKTLIGNNTETLALTTLGTERLIVKNNGDIEIKKKLEVLETISAQTYAESSLRKLKENIKPYASSGLDKINNLKIVRFNKIDGAKNKIGIIADDSDNDFLTEEKNAVDLYKTIFVQAKAIQELSSRLDQLEKNINNG